MRQLLQEQPSFTGPMVNHPHARELAEVDRILRLHPGMLEEVGQDLRRGASAERGREGMSAEQALRAALGEMLQHDVRWLPVVDHTGRYLGVLTPNRLHAAMRRSLGPPTERVHAGRRPAG